MNIYNTLPQTQGGYYYTPQQYSRPMMAQSQEPQQVYMPQMNYIKGRPVVSIDEARASQIDLDGSLYVFPDLGNKKIYTKQINMDGTASFNIFELAVPVAATPEAPVEYVTKAQLNEILAEFKASLDIKPQKQTFNL